MRLSCRCASAARALFLLCLCKGLSVVASVVFNGSVRLLSAGLIISAIAYFLWMIVVHGSDLVAGIHVVGRHIVKHHPPKAAAGQAAAADPSLTAAAVAGAAASSGAGAAAAEPLPPPQRVRGVSRAGTGLDAVKDRSAANLVDLGGSVPNSALVGPPAVVY